MALDKVPKITWKSGFAKTLDIGYLVDNPVSYGRPRDGSEVDVGSGGQRDSWILGTDYFLEVDIRWIPGTDTTNPTASGWDATDGWEDFLAWVREQNIFRWYPDKDQSGYNNCKLVEPFQQKPDREEDGTARIRLVMVDTDGNEFTGYKYTP